MRRRTRWPRAVHAILLVALAGCADRPVLRQTAESAPLGRQILVTVAEPGTAAAGLTGDPATVYLRRPGYGAGPQVERVLREVAAEFGLRRVDGWQVESLGIYCEVFETPASRDVPSLIERLVADARIEDAQPMHRFSTEAVEYNDPLVSLQPALAALAVDFAHATTTGRGVRVAVVDSRIDDRHPEIRGRVPVRRNLVRNRSSRRPELHGTAVAGIIASRANNAEGIVGVAPDAEVVALRACWTVDETSGRADCSSFSLARSLDESIRLGVDIINLSLSGPPDPLVGRLIDAAVEAGVIVVAALPGTAAGSQGGFPASHPGVIAAGAAGSIPGAVTAPGTEVLSTVPGAEYGFFSGNSMAAAFVAGVAALLVELEPGLTGAEVREVLAATASAESIDACRAVARIAAGPRCVTVTGPPAPTAAATPRSR